MSNRQQQHVCTRKISPSSTCTALSLVDVILGPATATVENGHVVALHSYIPVYFYAHSHAINGRRESPATGVAAETWLWDSC